MITDVNDLTLNISRMLYGKPCTENNFLLHTTYDSRISGVFGNSFFLYHYELTGLFITLDQSPTFALKSPRRYICSSAGIRLTTLYSRTGL